MVGQPSPVQWSPRTKRMSDLKQDGEDDEAGALTKHHIILQLVHAGVGGRAGWPGGWLVGLFEIRAVNRASTT